jgi:polyhydroxyalkanoate synthesis repressor PhaR
VASEKRPARAVCPEKDGVLPSPLDYYRGLGLPLDGKRESAPAARREFPVEMAEKEPERSRRVVKRYSNRKLYDTKDSRYVTLLQIGEMIRSGEEVQIIDNNTKDDLTEVTLAQIIYEEQKAKSRSVPLQTLKELLHERTEKVLSDLREGPIGRLIPGGRAEASPTQKDPPKPEPPRATSLVDQAKEKLEDWQHQIDERVKAVVPSLLPWQQLERDVKRLTQRVEELEAQVGKKGEK